MQIETQITIWPKSKNRILGSNPTSAAADAQSKSSVEQRWKTRDCVPTHRGHRQCAAAAGAEAGAGAAAGA